MPSLNICLRALQHAAAGLISDYTELMPGVINHNLLLTSQF